MSNIDWFQTEGDFPIIARPALPKDTQEVLGFTRRIWEGEDYVPVVWPDWLVDPVGLLVVAEYKSHVIGTGKLTKLSQGQWWLEGLRVHPYYEGKGVASHLNDYLLDYWHRTGDGIIRLATASTRIPVRHLCERSGFRQIGEFSIYAASASKVSTQGTSRNPFSQLDHQEVQNGLDFVVESPALMLSSGLMDLGWQWASPTAYLFEAAIRRRQAMWWGERRGLLITREDFEENDRALYIQLLACNLKDMVPCLKDFRWLTGQKGFHEAKWIAPIQPEVESLILAAGFQCQWENSLLIYEKKHTSSA